MRQLILHRNGFILIGILSKCLNPIIRVTLRKRGAESGERREAERDREHTFHSLRRRGESVNRLSAAAEHSEGTSSIPICRVH